MSLPNNQKHFALPLYPLTLFCAPSEVGVLAGALAALLLLCAVAALLVPALAFGLVVEIVSRALVCAGVPQQRVLHSLNTISQNDASLDWC